MHNHLSLGLWGENYAWKLYAKQGFKLLVQNSFNHTGKRMGEIDLVLRHKQWLVFVEVKTRLSVEFGAPEESISASKKLRLLRVVQWFLNSHAEYQVYQPRIDVCAIMLSDGARLGNFQHFDKFVKYAKIISNAVDLN
jgi:putative endonuclease